MKLESPKLDSKYEDEKRLIDKTHRTVSSFNSGYLTKGKYGYKFRVREFIETVFLYINGVDRKNPDILGKHNDNSFVLEANDLRAKIKEQVRLELKDISFLLKGSAAFTNLVAKSANRKALRENNAQMEFKQFADDGVDYGSGFLKCWINSKSKLKIKSIFPTDMIFDIQDFKGGLKIEPKMERMRDIKKKDIYDSTKVMKLYNALDCPPEEERDDQKVMIYHVYEPIAWNDNEEATEYKISVIAADYDIVLYQIETDEVYFYKWDYDVRAGFKDALGVGLMEKIFNLVVKSKTAQKRLEAVMKVSSVGAYQKQVDGKTDANVGKQLTKIKTGTIIGHKGNKIEKLDLVNDGQIIALTNELTNLGQSMMKAVNVNDVIQGNTLPSGTSGILGNLLNENASSVHKDTQKNLANAIERFYLQVGIPYMLGVYKKDDDLKDFLDPNDIKSIEREVRNYFILLEQIQAEIDNVEFDPALANKKADDLFEGNKLIPNDLLDNLRDDAKSIQVIITGEKQSKAQTVAFIQYMRDIYLQNPEIFKDPTFIELLKKQAEYEQGLDPLEIDQLFDELQ